MEEDGVEEILRLHVHQPQRHADDRRIDHLHRLPMPKAEKDARQNRRCVSANPPLRHGIDKPAEQHFLKNRTDSHSREADPGIACLLGPVPHGGEVLMGFRQNSHWHKGVFRKEENEKGDARKPQGTEGRGHNPFFGEFQRAGEGASSKRKLSQEQV